MLPITTYANVSYSDDDQINFIKQAMEVNDRLKELYGDFIAKIKGNSK